MYLLHQCRDKYRFCLRVLKKKYFFEFLLLFKQYKNLFEFHKRVQIMLAWISLDLVNFLFGQTKRTVDKLKDFFIAYFIFDNTKSEKFFASLFNFFFFRRY